jgi:tRNA pseudouridine38-40 synthase
MNPINPRLKHPNQMPKKITRNIRLKIEYDGTGFNGWQAQNDKNRVRPQRTIQQTIETVLNTILQEDIRLIGSGRTDSGVHALGQVANFRTRSAMPLRQIQRALNGLLPGDIVITSVKEVSPGFHSRYDASSKIYRYSILNCPHNRVFSRLYQCHIAYGLDHKLMKKAAHALTGRKDFRSFQASDKKDRGSVRDIRGLSVKRQGHIINIDIEADGFLYNMVRNIVGTLIEIGKGRLAPGRIGDILDAKDRRMAGPTAPAKGLCLMRVRYKRGSGQ